MKRKKELVKTIREVILASTKSKIIAGSIAGLVIVGGVAGGSYYWYSQNNPSVAGQGKVDGSLVNNKDANLTSDDKKYDDKVIKLNSIVESIKELDPEFKYDDSVSVDTVDELTKKYSDKRQDLLVQKEKENQAKKDDGEKNKEVSDSGSSADSSSNPGGSSPNGSSNGGGSSHSGGSGSSGGSSTPSPAPTPTPEPKPEPPAPTKPSGWRQDIADAIASRSSTANTNSTSGANMVMTASQLSNLNSWSEQWKSGSISAEQFIANAKNDAQSNLDGIPPVYLTSIVLDTQTFSGDNPSTMYPRGSGHHYIWSRAYYDGSSDNTTVYFVSGTMSRPGR